MLIIIMIGKNEEDSLICAKFSITFLQCAMLYLTNHEITLSFKKPHFIVNKNSHNVKSFSNCFPKFKDFAISFFIQFIYLNNHTSTLFSILISICFDNINISLSKK